MTDLQALFFAPENILFSESQGRRFAARRGRKEVWAVNPVAGRTLELLNEPRTLATLCSVIANEYDIEFSACASVLSPYLKNLEQLGWIEPLPDLDPAAVMRRRYLELLKRALVNLLYPEHELWMRHVAKAGHHVDKAARDRELRDIRHLQPDAYAALIHCKHFGEVMYGEPTRDSHTMVGLRRLNNLEYCARRVFAEQVAGDFLEAGVCQGGATIFLRALQVAFGEEERRTWVADSFQGLPPPVLPQDISHNMDFIEARFPWLAISEETVRENFRIYDLLSEQVRFIPGWFDQTLESTPTGPLALLRVDADLYQSTRDVLAGLYDRVSVGGYVIIDDYGSFAACRKAVDEFRQHRGITEDIRFIDSTGIFWRKMR